MKRAQRLLALAAPAALRAACLAAAGLAIAHAAAQEIPPGGDLFGAACAACHGENGAGSAVAPSILRRVLEDDDAALAAFLRAGNPARGMPPAAVAEADLPRLVGYLRLLASAGAAASRDGGQVSAAAGASPLLASFEPLTDEKLLDPDSADWIWFSRTPDAQRFSPLDEINSRNVGGLALAWSRGLPDGLTTTIPTVYRGIMYLTQPDSSVVALDATNGDLLWEYKRVYAEGVAAGARSKNLSLYGDMVYFTAPDSAIVALDARTGGVRWEARAEGRGHTGGSIVADGKVISNGNCLRGPRENCFIAAHDAQTGDLVWKFFTAQAPTDPPGVDSWNGTPLEDRLASPWGLPGSYDAETQLVFWGVANPMPNTRAARHGGDSAAVGYAAPVDLYSNSTLALRPATGELAWYYQHLPGDDWDLDMNQERIVLRTRIAPDPKHVRWINPNVARGSERDVVVNVGEGGGLWVLDKRSGEFLWATPFPEDVDNFAIGDIDVTTGRATINRALIVDEPGERHTICFFNTRSFWATAYHPGKNALYVPYVRNCLDMTSEIPATATSRGARERRVGTPQAGIELDELNGLARVDMETGEITHWRTGRIPTNTSVVVTAGNLVFWGDIDRRYRAMDADTGEVLWETRLGGPASVGNVTYAVNGRQYVAVIAGSTLSQRVLTTGDMGPIRLDLGLSHANNTVYVFALPDGRR